MAKYVDWHGTVQESKDLQQALNRHCSCRLGSDRALERCGPHQLLVDGPDTLHRLLFIRRISERLLCEELQLVDQAGRVVDVRSETDVAGRLQLPLSEDTDAGFHGCT
jgi:hypothetical protein